MLAWWLPLMVLLMLSLVLSLCFCCHCCHYHCCVKNCQVAVVTICESWFRAQSVRKWLTQTGHTKQVPSLVNCERFTLISSSREKFRFKWKESFFNKPLFHVKMWLVQAFLSFSNWSVEESEDKFELACTWSW